MKSIIKAILKKGRFLGYKLGRSKQCVVCDHRVGGFAKFRGGYKKFPMILKIAQNVGSDVNNFWCPYCLSTDRERHLYLFFERINFWDKLNGASILHFAPERNLTKKIEEFSYARYIKADLFPANKDIMKVDATNMPFDDSSIDVLFFNHILEHIPDYRKALSEIHRVLKPGSTAILQTPYSKILSKTFEDEAINTDNLRRLFYGQEDHVRIFSERDFFGSLREAGFELNIIDHEEFFTDRDAVYYGVPKVEKLIMVRKPMA